MYFGFSVSFLILDSFQCNWEDSELLFQKLLSAFKQYHYVQATGWEQKKEKKTNIMQNLWLDPELSTSNTLR